MEGKVALLTLGDGPQFKVTDEHHLGALLEPLSTLIDGEVVTLAREPSDFIKATRCGQLWSVTTRRGGMWTAQSFTAEMTTEYSERRAREERQYGSLRSRFMRWLRSPPPERTLSSEQVRTIFGEYLEGKKFTLPMSGA